jgi:hypothetical protein
VTDPGELRRVNAALRLGDPALPPPGTRVRFLTATTPNGDAVFGTVVDFEREALRVELDLEDGVGAVLSANARKAGVEHPPVRVVAAPGDLEVLEVPASALPFDNWPRLSEKALRVARLIATGPRRRQR